MAAAVPARDATNHEPLVAFSAPGKVLLAGGYLVTDRAHTGLVLGLSARIHVLVRKRPAPKVVGVNEIVVRSPQFQNAVWRYAYQHLDDGKGVEVHQLNRQGSEEISRNKFIEVALFYVLNYVSSMDCFRFPSLEIIVLADSNYYSESTSWTTCPTNLDSPFMDFNSNLYAAHKTGLGSSAALVTALVGALLTHCLGATGESLATPVLKSRVHNLAQIAHCVAQGKIGSGFDVAAAAFGSCVYRRFSSSILTGIDDIGKAESPQELRSTVDDQVPDQIWDYEVNAELANFPRRLRLLMCDVDCGTETPNMVRKVMAWRKAHPSVAKRLWCDIQSVIDELVAELRRLCLEPDRSLQTIARIISANRSLVREMSAKADVPIEPDVQGDLIDACCRIDGVIGGVVPGAGGYDAIALVVENREEVVQHLWDYLAQYNASGASAGDIEIATVRLLDVKQESEGLRAEQTVLYKGWL